MLARAPKRGSAPLWSVRQRGFAPLWLLGPSRAYAAYYRARVRWRGLMQREGRAGSPRLKEEVEEAETE